MRPAYQYVKIVALIFLAVTLTIAVTGTYVNAWVSYPEGNLDFVLTASTTLVKMQPGQSGSLVVWVRSYCHNFDYNFTQNSTANHLCDSDYSYAPLNVNLQFSGCPTSAFCALDRQQVLAPFKYEGNSHFVVYSLSSFCPPSTICPAPNVSTIIVTGTDMFGHTHSVRFGVVIGYY